MKLPKMPSFRLDNKRALIVGSSSGIGIGCATALADAGASVVLAARRKDLLDDLKKETYKDLPVDKEHLDTESLRNQDLYAKYLDYKTNFEFLLAKAKGE